MKTKNEEFIEIKKQIMNEIQKKCTSIQIMIDSKMNNKIKPTINFTYKGVMVRLTHETDTNDYISIIHTDLVDGEIVNKFNVGYIDWNYGVSGQSSLDTTINVFNITNVLFSVFNGDEFKKSLSNLLELRNTLSIKVMEYSNNNSDLKKS